MHVPPENNATGHIYCMSRSIKTNFSVIHKQNYFAEKQPLPVGKNYSRLRDVFYCELSFAMMSSQTADCSR